MQILRHIKKITTSRWLLIVFTLLYLFFALFTYKDYGLTNDEFFVYMRGKYFYTKVKTNDKLTRLNFVEDKGYNQNLLFWNSTYPALLYVFNDNNTFEVYHLLNMLFSILIFVALFELLLYRFKNQFYAILGPLLLFFTPRFLGHIPANPKDIPFSVMYFLVLTIFYFKPRINEKLWLILTGILLGVTISFRSVGAVLIFVYIVYWLYENNFLINTKDRVKRVINLVFDLVIILTFAFLIFMFSYPFVAIDPVHNLLKMIKFQKKISWYATVLLFGKKYYPDQRPWYYLPVWITITTPLLYLLLSLTSLIKILKDKLVFLMVTSIVFTMLLYFSIHPVVYDGMRHFLFLLPQIIVLATVGVRVLINKFKKQKLILYIFIFAQLFFIAFHYITFHPYEYVFFNSLLDGVKGAQHKFELEYWGAGDKEALMWLKKHVVDKTKKKIKVRTCSKSHSLHYYLPEAIDVNQNPEQADYVVCYARFTNIKDIKGKVVYKVERRGIPLNYVIKIN